MRPSTLRRSSIAEQVAESLRDQIINNQLGPGTRLVETDLATALGISRTPLREAIAKLAEEGLIDVYPQFGSFVAQISLSAVNEAQFVREHLECALIREAALKITPKGLAELRRILKQQSAAADEGDAVEFHRLDEAMHAKFAELAGHAGVGALIRVKKAHLDRVRHVCYGGSEHLHALVEQHGAVVNALAKHDPDAAATALRTHLRDVCATIDALFNQASPPGDVPKRRKR